MKKLFAILVTAILAVTACFGLTACGGDEKGSLEDGKLTIGYTIYAPMNFYDDNNTFVGFDTELAKAFCAEIGVEAEFVEINWNNKFIDLNGKKIDVIWNGMTITDEVKEKTAVSKPYLDNKQVVICKAENADKFTDIASIKNASSVAFEKGSAGEDAVKDIDITKIEASAQKDTLLEVASGRSEIAVIDLMMARVLVGAGTSYSNLVYKDVGFELEEFGVAFRKTDDGLAKAFDLFIKIAKTNGLFDTLSAKYFG